MAFTLPDLTYATDALEPNIDARTMEIHHDKHHAGYTNKLNAAIDGTALADKSIEDILANVSSETSQTPEGGAGGGEGAFGWLPKRGSVHVNANPKP